jgi:hypothetical protein
MSYGAIRDKSPNRPEEVPAILLMGDRTVGTPLIEWLRRVDPRSIEDLPSALSTCEWLGQVRRLQAGFQPMGDRPEDDDRLCSPLDRVGQWTVGDPLANPFYLH